MGRNVQYYCEERFGGRLHDLINSSKKPTVLADDIVTRAGMIQELVMVSHGRVTGDYFAPADVDALIAQLCVDWFLNFGFYLFFAFILFFMSVFCVLRV